LLSADDIHGELAERYGYVNPSLPDAELDGFVDALAMRIASFDKQAIADTKRLVDVASLPPDAEIKPEWDALSVASIALETSKIGLASSGSARRLAFGPAKCRKGCCRGSQSST
jgi:enoyl-CoA hydratase/carnithine racemase